MATEATSIRSRTTTASLKRQFATNAASGVVAQGITVGVGLILMPYLISQLGTKAYGISQLAQSILIFFSLLQLGMTPTLVRYCSQAITRNDQKALSQVSSTAQLILGTLGILGMLSIIGFIPFFLVFYDIPPEMAFDASGLLLCLAVSLLLNFIFIVPSGLVLGSNRYDQANGIEIIASLLRFGLVIFIFWLCGPSLLLLGVCILSAQAFRFVMYFAFAITHTGRAALFSIQSVSRETLKSLLGFSSLNLTNTLANALVIQGPVLIVGKVLGTEAVTLFTPAVLISTAAQSLLSRIGMPLVPLASKAQAENNQKKMGEWSIMISGFATLVGLAMAIPFCVFGDKIIGFWLGADMSRAWIPVAILLTDTVVSQASGTNCFLAMGGGCIRPIAYSQIALGLTVSGGAVIGTVFMGWHLIGVVVFIMACRCLRNTLYLTYAYSKQFLYSVPRYLWLVHAKPLFLSVGISVIGFIIKAYVAPDQLLLLGLEVIIILTMYMVLAWHFLLAVEIQSSMRRFVSTFRKAL